MLSSRHDPQPHRDGSHHLLLLMRTLDSLQPREPAPGEYLGHWPPAKGCCAVKHSRLDICYSLAARSVPVECCATSATKVARHDVSRVGSRAVLLRGAGDTDLIQRYGPVEGEGRAGDPLAVEAVAEGLGDSVSTYSLGARTCQVWAKDSPWEGLPQLQARRRW